MKNQLRFFKFLFIILAFSCNNPATENQVSVTSIINDLKSDTLVTKIAADEKDSVAYEYYNTGEIKNEKYFYLDTLITTVNYDEIGKVVSIIKDYPNGKVHYQKMNKNEEVIVEFIKVGDSAIFDTLYFDRMENFKTLPNTK